MTASTHCLRRRIILPALFLITGCTGATAPESPGESRASIEERLAEGVALDVRGDLSRVRLAGEVSHERFDRDDIEVRSGEIVLRTTGRDALVLETLDVSIGDIEVTDVVVAGGLHLTDVHAHLAAPASGAITWSGEEGYAEIAVDLVASWSLVTDSGTIPLAPQEVHDLVVGVTVRAEPSGDLVTELSAHAQGDVIDWPTVGYVDELNVDLAAREIVF